VVLPCPFNKCDDSVRLQHGDLMLCPACTESHFPTVMSTAPLPTAKYSPSATPSGIVSDILSDKSKHATTNNQCSIGAVMPASEVNEVLSYILHGYKKGALNVLKSVIYSSFTGEALATAKLQLHYYTTFVGLPSLKRPIARAGPNKAKNELEDICLIIQQLDECHLLNKLPKFYIADLDLIPTIKVSDVDVVILAKCLDRIEQRLLALSIHWIKSWILLTRKWQ